MAAYRVEACWELDPPTSEVRLSQDWVIINQAHIPGARVRELTCHIVNVLSSVNDVKHSLFNLCPKSY